MIVVDASVLVTALIDDAAAGAAARAALSKENDWFSVGHLYAEVVSGIRGRLLGGRLDGRRADRAIAELGAFTVSVVGAPLLLARTWQLRDNLSAYDACYVAAAEVLGCPLVTSDRWLAGAPGLRCEVRLAA